MRDGSSYFVLLIITDGEITDMQQTKNAIVEVILSAKETFWNTFLQCDMILAIALFSRISQQYVCTKQV